MSIAEIVQANQDVKEMTRRAIKIAKACGADVSDLELEFQESYGESVF